MQPCAAPPFDRADIVDRVAGRGVPSPWCAHDLLRLRALAHRADDAPAWVAPAFAATPFAVVRRAYAAPGWIAVGVRGEGRAQRFATWAHIDDVLDARSPESLLSEVMDDAGDAAMETLPAALRALRLLKHHAALRDFQWGPAGSAGFELATRQPTLTAASDLDLLIRTPQRIATDAARALSDALGGVGGQASVRIDAQLETPAGGVALLELASGKRRVMARHARGPFLTDDPWASDVPVEDTLATSAVTSRG